MNIVGMKKHADPYEVARRLNEGYKVEKGGAGKQTSYQIEQPNFVHIPFLDADISLNYVYHGKWKDCVKALHSAGLRMPNIYELAKFLQYQRSTNTIDSLMKMCRGEYLDAFFPKRDVMDYNHTADLEKEESMALQQGVFLGNSLVDFEMWTNNCDSSGLPQNTGDAKTMFYCQPLQNCVAFFGVTKHASDNEILFLDCGNEGHEEFGVRALRGNKYVFLPF